MPQSRSSILIHLVFSTKNREPFIHANIEAELHPYLASSNVAQLKRYIRRQKQHHRRITFQDEYRKFLKLYEVEYDERYVWD